MSSPSPPRLSLPSDLEAPSPTYSPNSAASSPRSTSIRGNSFQKITQILGYSSNPESQPSTPLPQEPQQNHPSSPAEEAQDTSVGDESFDEKKRNSKRSSNVNENGYADEKKKRNSYRFSMDDFRKSFIDVKDLRRPINYSYIGTIVLHVVLVSHHSSALIMMQILPYRRSSVSHAALFLLQSPNKAPLLCHRSWCERNQTIWIRYCDPAT